LATQSAERVSPDADSPNTFLDADAVVIDTADLTVDAVVTRVVDLVRVELPATTRPPR
jgi:hypothetical protein